MNQIRKGMCPGCPFDYGKPLTEEAYNLGCLPTIGEVSRDCLQNGTAWACHDDPGKVCCGYAAQNKGRIGLPLEVQDGVHRPWK